MFSRNKTGKSRGGQGKRGLTRNLYNAHERVMSYENFNGDENYEEDYEDDYEEAYENLSVGEQEALESEYYENAEEYGEHVAKARMRQKGKKGQGFLRYGLGTKAKSSTLTGAIRAGYAKATFAVKVTRNSFNINATLPVEIFNVIDIYADNATIKRYLPAGVVLASSNVDATRTNWVFTFQQGNVTDTVTVSCAELAYNKLVLATQSDLMRIGSILYKISDQNQQQQFSAPFTVVEQTLFGKGKENPLTITNFINPRDFRLDTVNLRVSMDIDKQTGFVMGMTYPTGQITQGYTNSVTLSFTVTMFDQWTRSKMGKRA